MSITDLTAGITNAAVIRFSKLATQPRPSAGWSRVIREALGMTRTHGLTAMVGRLKRMAGELG